MTENKCNVPHNHDYGPLAEPADNVIDQSQRKCRLIYTAEWLGCLGTRGARLHGNGKTDKPKRTERRDYMTPSEKELKTANEEEYRDDAADIIEEIEIEDLTVDGICGVY
jgi:mycofactocin precursor